jgi:hypothetical protein
MDGWLPRGVAIGNPGPLARPVFGRLSAGLPIHKRNGFHLRSVRHNDAAVGHPGMGFNRRKMKNERRRVGRCGLLENVYGRLEQQLDQANANAVLKESVYRLKFATLPERLRKSSDDGGTAARSHGRTTFGNCHRTYGSSIRHDNNAKRANCWRGIHRCARSQGHRRNGQSV